MYCGGYSLRVKLVKSLADIDHTMGMGFPYLCGKGYRKRAIQYAIDQGATSILEIVDSPSPVRWTPEMTR
jgi:hypothetical protein